MNRLALLYINGLPYTTLVGGFIGFVHGFDKSHSLYSSLPYNKLFPFIYGIWMKYFSIGIIGGLSYPVSLPILIGMFHGYNTKTN
jgi:hypothetical protein